MPSMHATSYPIGSWPAAASTLLKCRMFKGESSTASFRGSLRCIIGIEYHRHRFSAHIRLDADFVAAT